MSAAKTGMIPVLVLVAFCGSRPATQADCRQILDRIVDVELNERGFHDPALAARRREEAEAAYAADILRCVGGRIARGAMECVRSATTSEEISHRCLR
jgi:hypothetical protein